MKHFFVLVSAIFGIVTGAAAQDTLYSATPKDNYFHNFWPQELKPGDTIRRTGIAYNSCNSGSWEGTNFIAPDSLTIYGIAVGVMLEDNPNIYPDTTILQAYIALNAIDQTPMGKIRVGEDLFLYGSTPPDYYWNFGFEHPFPSYYYNPTPMYELYYNEPITVYDSFLLGGCETLHQSPSNRFVLPGWLNTQHPFSQSQVWVGFVPQGTATEGWETTPGHWSYTHQGRIYLIFPILTPNPDSTFYEPNDSTQTSLQQVLWERHVSVKPNPAKDMVSVLSSVGMEKIEVFGMTGNRVMMHEASGFSAKIDVATLPRGTYIVHIHTPMGITSRKLLLN